MIKAGVKITSVRITITKEKGSMMKLSIARKSFNMSGCGGVTSPMPHFWRTTLFSLALGFSTTACLPCVEIPPTDQSTNSNH